MENGTKYALLITCTFGSVQYLATFSNSSQSSMDAGFTDATRLWEVYPARCSTNALVHIYAPSFLFPTPR